MADICGVYKIECIANGRIYIGSSVNIYKRMTAHRSQLRANKHFSILLQRNFNKYGDSAFAFTPLLVCSRELRTFYEARAIASYKAELNVWKNPEKSFNDGKIYTEEEKNVLGEASRRVWEKRRAEGWTHPGFSEASLTRQREGIRRFWAESEKANEMRKKISAGNKTARLSEIRSQNARELWADPLYREKAINSRLGKAYNKGYKCTPEQIENRKKAARISNIKRKYGDSWKTEYISCYPEHAGDLDGR